MQSEKEKELLEDDDRKKKRSRKIKFYTIIVSLISLWALFSNDIVEYLNVNRAEKFLSEEEVNSLGRINANFQTIIEKLEKIENESNKILIDEPNQDILINIRNEFFAIEFLQNDLYSQYESYLLALNQRIEKEKKKIRLESEKDIKNIDIQADIIKNIYEDISKTDDNINNMAKDIKEYIEKKDNKPNIDKYIKNIQDLYINISNNISSIVIEDI